MAVFLRSSSLFCDQNILVDSRLLDHLKKQDVTTKITSLVKGNVSLMPFQIFDLCSQTLWHKFVNKSVEATRSTTPDSSTQPLTTCSYNTFAIAVLFLGKKTAAVAIRRLMLEQYPCLSYPYGALNFRYRIHNLLCGDFICRLDQAIPDSEYDKEAIDHELCRFKEPFIRLFKSTGPLLDSAKEKAIQLANNNSDANAPFVQALEKCTHDFNYNVINSLEDSIKYNSFHVDKNRSFSYLILILHPEKHAEIFRGESVSDTECVFHAFAIEQFHLLGQTRYRLYQACQDLMTLKQYFQKNLYGTSNHGLAEDEFFVFLRDLRTLVSHPAEKSRDELTTIAAKCFGAMSGLMPPVNHFSPSKQTFYGLSLRYICRGFDPALALENMVELVPEMIHEVLL